MPLLKDIFLWILLMYNALQYTFTYIQQIIILHIIHKFAMNIMVFLIFFLYLLNVQKFNHSYHTLINTYANLIKTIENKYTFSVKQNSKQLFLSNFHIIKNGLILLFFNKLQQDSFSFIHNFSFWNQEFIL